MLLVQGRWNLSVILPGCGWFTLRKLFPILGSQADQHSRSTQQWTKQFPCHVKHATMLTADWCTQNIATPCSYCSSLKMKAVETFIKIISIVFDKWRAFLKHCIISFAFPKSDILLNLYIKLCTILCNWVRYLSHNAPSRGN